MTFPRRILPGLSFLITRRTLRRTHLLRPDAELNNLFRYCLAYAADRNGIAVHCATVMSSHEHLVVTDTRGTLPRFLHDLHRTLALGIKVLRRWEGAVWDHEKTSVVELRTEQAVLEKIAYCIANPVAAGLVRSADQWPGVTLSPTQLGRTVWTAKRPQFYLDQDNPQWPAALSLTLQMPRLTIDDALAREMVDSEVKRLEREARETAKARAGACSAPPECPRSRLSTAPKAGSRSEAAIQPSPSGAVSTNTSSAPSPCCAPSARLTTRRSRPGATACVTSTSPPAHGSCAGTAL
jgi:hypothetical protein